MLKRITLCAIVAIAMSSVASAIPIELFLPMDHNDLPLALRPFGNEGYVSSGVDTVSAFYGLFFDGGDVVTIDSSSALQPSAITVEFWIYRDIAWNDTYNTIIWSKGADSTTTGWFIDVGKDSAAVRFMVDDSTAFIPDSLAEEVLPYREWHRVAVSYGNDTATIYIDGAKILQDSIGGILTASDSAFNIGGDAGGHAPSGIYLSHIVIWNEVRDSAQIELDHFDLNPDSAVAYWPLTPGTGQTVTDASGNGHTGTRGASASSSTDDPWWTTTYSAVSDSGPAPSPDIATLTYDGNDYARTTSSFSPGGSNGRHLSAFAWAKVTQGYVVGQYLAAGDQKAWVIQCYNGKYESVAISENGISNTKQYYYNGYSTGAWAKGDRWYHVGFTWGDSTLTLYVDGAVSTPGIQSDAGMDSIFQAKRPLTIGANNATTPSLFTSGEIGSVWVFGITLTPDQVTALYNGTWVDSSFADSTQVYYRMRGSELLRNTQDVTDEGPNGYNLRRGSAAGSDTNDPTWSGPYQIITTDGPVE